MTYEDITPHHIFPTLRSLLSVDALAKLLATAYGFTDVRCQLIKAMLSDTYLVTTVDNSYILRIYLHNSRTASEIKAELNFISFLDSKGIPVSVTIPQKNGELLLLIPAIEGPRYAVLFTHIKGQALSQAPTVQNVQRYGSTIARIHMLSNAIASVSNRPRIDIPLLLDRSLEALDTVLTLRSGDVVYLHQLVDTLKPRIANLPVKKPQYGLCHGDVDSSNALVSVDGHIVPLDFDFCGLGWRAYDIACFLSDAQFSQWPPEVSQAFLAGYQEIRPLADDEQATLPLFQIARNIWSLGIFAAHVNEWGSFRLSDRFVNSMLTNIRSLEESLV